MLVGAVLCFLAFFGLAAALVALAVRAERRRDASRPPRQVEHVPHATADLAIYLRFEEEADARAIAGGEAEASLRSIVERILARLDGATHGAVVIAGYKIVPVRGGDAGGTVVGLHVHSRVPVAIPARPSHRHDLAALLRELAALDDADVVSSELALGRRTKDRAAPALELLLGPHPAASSNP